MYHVWYVGYGSNLCEERFLCYIRGGRFKLGGGLSEGCEDKTPPPANDSIEIPFPIYFAKNADKWDKGGVAFIDSHVENNGRTFGRMWKVTIEQFECVRDQEGRTWYDKKVKLGRHKDGSMIVTATNGTRLSETRPSASYLKTITLGLRETFRLSDDRVLSYLLKIPGIEGYFSSAELSTIIASAR